NGRLTWQASSKDKIGVSTAWQGNCNCHFLVNNGFAPEATTTATFRPVTLTQATWSRTAPSRLLFPAGLTYNTNKVCHFRQPESSVTDIAVLELPRVYFYNSINGLGLSVISNILVHTNQTNGRASVSYVTGSHALKVGFTFFSGGQEADQDL